MAAQAVLFGNPLVITVGTTPVSFQKLRIFWENDDVDGAENDAKGNVKSVSGNFDQRTLLLGAILKIKRGDDGVISTLVESWLSSRVVRCLI